MVPDPGGGPADQPHYLSLVCLAIGVHRELGPGLLGSAYEECLYCALKQSGITFTRQVPLLMVYKGIRLDCGYRLDVVVQSDLILAPTFPPPQAGEGRVGASAPGDPRRAKYSFSVFPVPLW